MIALRRADDRGHFDHGWLNTYHSFSFADYYDPEHMGFRVLRVINEDFVQPGMGFGTHPHRDMEIITYVLEGSLEHRDSMGNGSVIRAGEIQRMSAGTGVTHSEFNPSKTEPLHLLQIWLLPEERGLTPSYEQLTPRLEDKTGKLALVASKTGRQGSAVIHQDSDLYIAALEREQTVQHTLRSGRNAWIQVVRGRLKLATKSETLTLHAGDGAAIAQETEFSSTGLEPAEFLLFDLP